MSTLAISHVSDSLEIAEKIKDVVETYYLDVIKYKDMSINEFFNLVKNLPYIVELGNYQLLHRPKDILSGNNAFVACANKSIAMASFLKIKGIPYKIKIVSDRDDLIFCHVFCIGYLKEWISFDCTYPENRIGQKREWTNEREV